MWRPIYGESDLSVTNSMRRASRVSSKVPRLDALLAASMAGHAALAEGDSLLALRLFQQSIGAAAPVEQLTWNVAGEHSAHPCGWAPRWVILLMHS